MNELIKRWISCACMSGTEVAQDKKRVLPRENFLLSFQSQNCHSEWEMTWDASQFDLSPQMSCRKSNGLQPYALVSIYCVSNVWHIFCDPSCTRKYQFLHMFPATKINLLYILIEQTMKKGVIVIKTQMNQVYLCLWWIWLSIKDNTFSSCFVAQSNLIIRKLRNLDRDLAIHVACAMHRSMHLT